MQRPCRDERCGRCALGKVCRRDGAMLSMVCRGYGRMCAEGLFGLDLCVALAGGIAGLEFARCFACLALACGRYCGLGARVLLRMFDVGLRAVLQAWRLRIASHVRSWITCGIAGLALAYCFACSALACVHSALCTSRPPVRITAFACRILRFALHMKTLTRCLRIYIHTFSQACPQKVAY